MVVRLGSVPTANSDSAPKSTQKSGSKSTFRPGKRAFRSEKSALLAWGGALFWRYRGGARRPPLFGRFLGRFLARYSARYLAKKRAFWLLFICPQAGLLFGRFSAAFRLLFGRFLGRFPPCCFAWAGRFSSCPQNRRDMHNRDAAGGLT